METTEALAAAPLAARPDNVPEDRVLDFNLHQPVPAGRTVHEFWRDAMARATHDVMWTPHNGGHWMVMDPDLCETVLTSPERFSSRVVIVPRDPMGEAYSKYIPLSLDPPHHGPFRKLLNDGLSPKMIARRKDAMRSLTIDLIEGFRAKGCCNFSHDFAEQVPIRIFLRLVDLPEADLPKLKYLADQSLGAQVFRLVMRQVAAIDLAIDHLGDEIVTFAPASLANHRADIVTEPLLDFGDGDTAIGPSELIREIFELGQVCFR